jgi:hypothetical protein
MGIAAGRDQRHALRRPGRRRSPRHHAVHQHRTFPHRHVADEDGERSVLPPQPRSDVREIPGAGGRVARSQQIADSVDIDIELGKYYFPNFECPDKKRPMDYLRELCIQGLLERYEGDDERIIDGKLRRGDGSTRSRTGRHRKARLSDLLFDRVGLRQSRAHRSASRRRPGAAASARSSVTRCICRTSARSATTCCLNDSSMKVAPSRRISTSTSKRNVASKSSITSRNVTARNGLPDRHLRNAGRQGGDQGHRPRAGRPPGTRQPDHRDGARRTEDHDSRKRWRKAPT